MANSSSGSAKGRRVKSLDQIRATAEKNALKRSLGAFQLILPGIGSVIGTGIYALAATAAQKARPGMMISFMISGAVCALAALCFSALASVVPVAGSACTYSYAVLGEGVAWLVGWALILEYALGASAVAVGWSGFFAGLLDHIGIRLPHALTVGPPIHLGFLTAAFLPVGTLADYSISGALFAFAAVSVGVMILRKQDTDRARPFRTPLLYVVAPLSIAGCALLFLSLNTGSKALFAVWAAMGLTCYFLYGYRHSNVARGEVDVPRAFARCTADGRRPPPGHSRSSR